MADRMLRDIDMLVYAVVCGQLEGVKFLVDDLEVRVDVCVDEKPLIELAERYGHEAIVAYLKSKGAK